MTENKKKHRLVILDFNGIFCKKRYRKANPLEAEITDSEWRKDIMIIDDMEFYINPNIKKFIKTIQKRHVLAIWSSTSKHYVKTVLAHIYSDWKERFLFVWSRNKCVKNPDPKISWMTIKPLTEVFKNYPQWNKKNTLIIDDDEHKVMMNKKYVIIKNDDLVKVRADMINEFEL